MAPEWEMINGNAPGYSTLPRAPAYMYGLPSADTLRIDDLLDFSNHDLFTFAAAADGHQFTNLPQDVSAADGRESGSSSECYSQPSSFPEDICIPSEEAAELEWLSKFVEDSFSDVPYPSATMPPANPQTLPDSTSNPTRGARSKRSRFPTVANWSAPQAEAEAGAAAAAAQSPSSSSSSDFPRKRGGGDGGIGVDERGVRRCTHCASERTPQWRTGPLGPKTLCNACGVRFKSGRLVPEYRPASSPSFVLTQHSNSHRKVMELRRQKEVHHHQQQQLHRRQQHRGGSSSSRLDHVYHDCITPLS